MSTREEEIKGKIEDLLEELEELSKRQRIISTHIETILTRGFLKRAEFDLSGANEQFELAETLAKKYSHHRLAERAHTEASYLKEQFSVLQQLMTHSPESFEQMQIQQMLDYIEGAQRIVRQTKH